MQNCTNKILHKKKRSINGRNKISINEIRYIFVNSFVKASRLCVGKRWGDI